MLVPSNACRRLGGCATSRASRAGCVGHTKVELRTAWYPLLAAGRRGVVIVVAQRASVITGRPDTRRVCSERSWVTVVTCGQRRQAARPSCENHRHSLRIVQGGRPSTTAG